jgi:hypothetical protein
MFEDAERIHKEHLGTKNRQKGKEHFGAKNQQTALG